MPVEPQLGEDRPVEGPDEEVGEQVGAGVFLEQPRHAVLARVQVVAVQPREPVPPASLAQQVERPVGAAVGVPDGDIAIEGRQLLTQLIDPLGDEMGLVVQQRRQRVDVDRPADPADELGAGLGDRAAGDERQRALP